MTTPAEYAAFVEQNGGQPGPFAVTHYQYSFFMYPGDLGVGGCGVSPKPGRRDRLPRTQDLEVAVVAALAWLRETDPPYDRAMVRRSGEHPTWLRADGSRWQLPESADLEIWGYSS